MTTYKKTVVMDCDDLRNFCIKHHFYTKGDNEAYSHLFELADKYDGNIDDLLNIANDIYEHSSGESLTNFCYSGMTHRDIICDLLTSIELDCTRSWYE